MLELIHMPLCPWGRKVRLVLAEKKMEARLTTASPWDMGDAIYDLNPAGELPVLLDGERPLADSGAIAEFLEETRREPSLIPGNAHERAEVRRLAAWFDVKFARDVTGNILDEKIYKLLKRAGEPDMARIRAGIRNLNVHLDYVSYLSRHRNWLAGQHLSLADFAAGAHLSCLDYVGVVPWSKFSEAAEWYRRLKSRPAFRGVLADRIPGFRPPEHYADPDF
ncbi:MAG: glutathione S-transferase family protein [Alphaproteobacteria bacterium]